jgi:hypothetical protein
LVCYFTSAVNERTFFFPDLLVFSSVFDAIPLSFRLIEAFIDFGRPATTENLDEFDEIVDEGTSEVRPKRRGGSTEMRLCMGRWVGGMRGGAEEDERDFESVVGQVEASFHFEVARGGSNGKEGEHVQQNDRHGEKLFWLRTKLRRLRLPLLILKTKITPLTLTCARTVLGAG